MNLFNDFLSNDNGSRNIERAVVLSAMAIIIFLHLYMKPFYYFFGKRITFTYSYLFMVFIPDNKESHRKFKAVPFHKITLVVGAGIRGIQ
jgi:hypothetical protein